MHYYVMNILDDDQNKLSLWENDQGKIYMEVGATDNEDAPYYTGFITLTTEDARALIQELKRLLNEIEPEQRILGELVKEGQANGEVRRKDHTPTSAPSTAREVGEFGLSHKQSSAFKAIAEIPEESEKTVGKQLTLPSKVNWGK